MAPLDGTTCDFLLLFYRNVGRISYRFCTTVDFIAEMTLLGDCDLYMTVKVHPDHLKMKSP